MTDIKAADLPVGSVVATSEFALFRILDGFGSVWHSTRNGRRHNDAEVDEMLADGAVLLRGGY